MAGPRQSVVNEPTVHESLSELIAAGMPSYSFEFFPPKTDEGQSALQTALS